MMAEVLTLYPAAALFCARETMFNVMLVEQLEKRFGYRALLPQRDGFEFSKLAIPLASHLPADQVQRAVEDVIYLADMGWFIPQSQVVLANLDEPLDPGVIVEIVHARNLGKRVVGYRTDVRSPYGTLEDPLRGVHFFPAYQCHSFLHFTEACQTWADVETSVSRLAEILHQEIQRQRAFLGPVLRPSREPQLLAIANKLFGGLDRLNDQTSLDILAQRYRDCRGEIAELRPVIRDCRE